MNTSKSPSALFNRPEKYRKKLGNTIGFLLVFTYFENIFPRELDFIRTTLEHWCRAMGELPFMEFSSLQEAP